MSHEKSTKPLLAQVTLFTLVVVVGLWMGAWILSVPTSNASSALPRLTFASPIPPVGNPQLGLVKTVNDGNPQPGDVIEYRLTYSTTNPGSQAFNVQLNDFLPAGVQFMSSNPPASYQDGRVLFTFPASPVGPAQESVTVQVRVLEGYEQLHNHALVTADYVTPTHDSLLTSVEQPPTWLNLSKMGYTAVLIDRELVYTLRCENTSGVTVDDAAVMDVLPNSLLFVNASPPPDPGGTLPVLTWSLGDLGSGESRTIVVTTTAPSVAGVITNTAIAYARQRVPTYTVFATQVISEGAILRVTKQSSAQEVEVGDELVYTLRYDNIGNQTATGVVLTDTLPADVTVTEIYSSATLITPQPLVWDIGTVPPGVPPGEIVITVTVDGNWGGTLHNVADITGQPGSFPGHAEVYTPVRDAMLYLPVVMRSS